MPLPFLFFFFMLHFTIELLLTSQSHTAVKGVEQTGSDAAFDTVMLIVVGANLIGRV